MVLASVPPVSTASTFLFLPTSDFPNNMLTATLPATSVDAFHDDDDDEDDEGWFPEPDDDDDEDEDDDDESDLDDDAESDDDEDDAAGRKR